MSATEPRSNSPEDIASDGFQRPAPPPTLNQDQRRVLRYLADDIPIPRRMPNLWAMSDLARLGLVRPNQARTHWEITVAGEMALERETHRKRTRRTP